MDASLGAATAHWQNETQDKQSIPDAEKAIEVAKLVDQLLTPTTSKLLEGATVLWVDDRPAFTTYERQALAALGIQFTLSRSTEDALERLEQKRYDVIITDMSRPPDKYAGYALLEKMGSGHHENDTGKLPSSWLYLLLFAPVSKNLLNLKTLQEVVQLIQQSVRMNQAR